MLTIFAIAKAAAFPLALAVLLVAVNRRSANRWLVLAAFVVGTLGAFSLNNAILRNLPSMLPDGQLLAANAREAVLSGFVEAAIPEELAKGAWLLVALLGWRQFSAGHGALVGGLVGLGFALRESLSYAQLNPEWRVMAALMHGAWGVILGSLLDRAVVASRPYLAVPLAFLPAILLHGLADTSIFLVDAYETQTGLRPEAIQPEAVVSPLLLASMGLTFAVDIFSLAWAIVLIRQARRRSAEPQIPESAPLELPQSEPGNQAPLA